jgi:SAM-dependent methyltransferase
MYGNLLWFRQGLGSSRYKYDQELRFWISRHTLDHGTFKNSHYKSLMLAMAEEEDPSFIDGKVVADFGCGPRGSLAWAERATIRIGIDVLVDRYLAEFKQDLISHGMIYMKSSEVAIPLPSSYVDLLFTLNAMDHVHNLSAMSCELRRILKPNGQLIGSFNIGEPPSATEPQSLTEESVKTEILKDMDLISYRVAKRGPEDNPYKYLLEQGHELELRERGFVWVRARKREQVDAPNGDSGIASPPQ